MLQNDLMGFAGDILRIGSNKLSKSENALPMVRLIDLVSLRAGGVGGGAETRFPN